MITKQQALYLLEEAFDVGDPVMVHGTSVESTIELLRTGILPSSFSPHHSEHPIGCGYLFFVPRKKSFHGHPLYPQLKIDLDGGKLENAVAGYAQDIQCRRFLMDVLGYWSDNYGSCDLESYDEANFDDMRRDGVDTEKMKKYGLIRLWRDVEKRRGVCIGINKKIFELEIRDGADVPGMEVMIKVPTGLDIKYVHYIYPLGKLEDEALRQFIAGLPE